jgi:putative phosphoesterase
LKKILLLSDTHGSIDESIVKHTNEADEIWHAGDIGTISIADQLSKIKPLRAVFGNIDGADVRSTYPQELFFIVGGVKVFMTHIGGYPGRYAIGIKDKLKTYQPDLFICGHSHILKVIRDTNLKLLHINPGAAGIHGFHDIRTMIRMQVENGKIHNLEVIELGKRGGLAKPVG